jgi:hypothetical protein
MKPKTEIQKEVDRYSHHLHKFTAEQKRYAYDNVFTAHVYKTKDKATCLTCGHTWEDATDKASLLHSVGGYTCPKCARHLTALPTMQRTLHDKGYIHQFITFKNYQVVRTCFIKRSCKAGQKAEYNFNEIIQHWIREDGKHVVRSVLYQAMGWNADAWCLGTDIEIRGDADKYYQHAKNVFPDKSILNVIRRNGYKGGFHDLHPAYFFHVILTYPIAETLLKAKQHTLLSFFGIRHVKELEAYWPQIKICIRNNYIIKDVGTWFDHLELLEYFGKDIHSPAFICSPTLKNDHQRLIAKKEKIMEGKRIAELKGMIAKANEKYQKTKQKYFNLRFSNGNVDVVVLNNVMEFYLEGKAHHHCVFTNEYYKNEDTLILSAQRHGERLETIELSLREMRILQARGLQNKETKHHKEIIKLVEQNIGTIRKLAQKVA